MMAPLVAALFGLAFGSFAAAAIDRIPRGRSLLGRSCCDACGRTLRAIELVPVLSYAALRGRCRTCAASIGPGAPVIEAACAIGFALAFAALPAGAASLACALGVTLLIAAGAARRTAHA